MIWIGLAIVVVTFYLIYKNYEARLVLALSGLVMAFIGQVVVGTNGGVSAAVDAFVKQLVNGGLVPTIVTVMGFGYVMTFTKCSDHLVNLLVKPLARVPVIVIPGAVIITWLLNIVLPSAAGIAAAVGVLLIPALIALKVRPVMAAAAVFIGTWGSVVSPGLMFNPQIADIAFKAKEIPAPDAMIVIMQEALPCAIGALVAAICLTIICIVLKGRRINGNRQRTSRRRRNPERLQGQPYQSHHPDYSACIAGSCFQTGRRSPDKGFLGSRLHADRYSHRPDRCFSQ